MRERSCIAIYHPNQSAVVGNDEVGVLVPVQERSQMFQSGLHVAIDHHPALSGEIASENNASLALRDCRGSFEQRRTDRKAARALVRRVLVLVARRIIELFARRMDKDR